VLAKLRVMLRSGRVAFSFLVEKLRHLPGGRFVERHAGIIATVLLVTALVVLGFWMAQRTPQRVSLNDLRNGVLSPLQRWIIVEGDIESQGKPASDYLYKMTDPNVPETQLTIFSTGELPVGHITVSGNLIGGTSKAAPGFAWVGQLRADSEVAREPEVPWLAIGLALTGLFLVVAVRTTYPVFFANPMPQTGGRNLTMKVGVRPERLPGEAVDLPGELSVQPGSSVNLAIAGAESPPLRLHSAQSSLEAGALSRVSSSEPALALHMATGDVILTFASDDDRDAAFGALAAHLRSGAGFFQGHDRGLDGVANQVN